MTARIIEQTMPDPYAWLDADPAPDVWAHVRDRE